MNSESLDYQAPTKVAEAKPLEDILREMDIDADVLGELKPGRSVIQIHDSNHLEDDQARRLVEVHMSGKGYTRTVSAKYGSSDRGEGFYSLNPLGVSNLVTSEQITVSVEYKKFSGSLTIIEEPSHKL